MELDELLRQLNLTGEDVDLECKLSQRGLSRDVWETVSAFANTRGGTVLLGVRERERRFEAVGIEDVAAVKHDLANGLRDALNVPIPALPETIVVQVGGQERVVVSLYVPEALPYQKPVYVRSKGLGAGAYKRVGGEDMLCTEEDLARFFQERATISPDMTPVPLARREELDPAQVQAFRRLLSTRDATNAVLVYSDDDLLAAYGATIQVEGRSDPVPTTAGVLMFGTPALIQRCLPAFRVDLIDVAGTEWMPAAEDRGESRAFQGPLLEVARELLRVLQREIPERFALRPGDVQRVGGPMQIALREAVHNALMHQDYRLYRPTQVRRYADRLEIENPGASLRDPERLGEPGSELRNPRVAQMFYEIGWAEQKGTGIRVIRAATESLGLTPPLFESDPADRSFRVTFYRHHFMDQADLTWLEQFRTHSLSPAEQRALIYVRKAGRINNAAYRQLSNTDTLTASRSLARLREAGLIQRSEQRKGPGVYYTLAAGIAESQQITPQIAPHIEVQPVESGLLVPPGKRLRPEELSRLVERLCAERPRTARELAALLQRNAVYLRERYLSPLVKAGRLELTGDPHDPNVAYQARK